MAKTIRGKREGERVEDLDVLIGKLARTVHAARKAENRARDIADLTVQVLWQAMRMRQRSEFSKLGYRVKVTADRVDVQRLAKPKPKPKAEESKSEG